MASADDDGRASVSGKPSQSRHFPAFRTDLHLFPHVAAGAAGGFLVRDPQTGAAFELDEREFFLCGQLDGHTSPEEVRARFERRHGQVLPREQLDAFVCQLGRQGLLVADSEVVRLESIGSTPGVLLRAPGWLQVERIFGWAGERLHLCFSLAFVLAAASIVILGAGVGIVHGGTFFSELKRLADGFQVLSIVVGVSALQFMNFIQSVSAATACRHGGGCVRWFGIRLIWYVYPVFRGDLADIAFLSKRSRYRVIWLGAAAQLLLGMLALIAWFSTAPHTLLRDVFLLYSAVLLVLLPLNPLGLRNAYYLLSAWSETPNLRSRSLNALWSWVSGKPALEPLTRRRKWGLRLFGLGEVLFYGFVATAIGYGILSVLIDYVDVTGTALALVAGGFLLEFPLREELMRFEPVRPWLARNDGRSTLAWVVRLGLIATLLLAMFLPYPYEPSGKLRILPARQFGVRARVQGRIQEVLVDEGDWVEAGQVLVRLDARRTTKDLELAQAELERARAQLSLLLVGGKPEEVARAREILERASAELYYARREADRMHELYGEDTISLSVYELALGRRDVSQGTYDTAVENLSVVTTGVKKETLDFQQTEIARLETRVRQYKEDLALAEVRSPAAGVVITPRIGERAGMEVFLGDMVASIQDSRELMAEVELPEKTAAEIEIGARAKLKVWAHPNRIFIGEVARIAPVVTNKGRMGTVEYLNTEREDALGRASTSEDERVVRVLVRLPNPDGLLKIDMTGYGKIFSHSEPFGVVMTHSLVRFFRVEVWSWIP